jgi:hypothetical protein
MIHGTTSLQSERERPAPLLCNNRGQDMGPMVCAPPREQPRNEAPNAEWRAFGPQA